MLTLAVTVRAQCLEGQSKRLKSDSVKSDYEEWLRNETLPRLGQPQVNEGTPARTIETSVGEVLKKEPSADSHKQAEGIL